ncbi:hypothetical protein BJV74DRAFT_799523 [Russula compacta]|nr:hypothetical protein BJV74DRAFT_799523 [Russula compacta]
MATCLAALPSLRWLYIGLRFYSDRINLSPPTRAVLPALSHFSFQGISEYLEELVARIDTPKLFHLNIVIDLIYNIPQLCKFIARTEAMRPLSPAEIIFSSSYTEIRLGPHYGVVMLRISCEGSDWQASSMARVCSQLSPLLSHVERLDIREHPPQENAIEKNAIDPSRWFDIFDPFSAVQRLYLYDELRPLVALALQVLIGERATEMLPTLRSLYLKGPPPSRSTREDIQLFIAARQHSNYPVDVHWE